MDRYTYFSNLQLDDFMYILHCLHSSNAITIKDVQLLVKELTNILEEYEEIYNNDNHWIIRKI